MGFGEGEPARHSHLRVFLSLPLSSPVKRRSLWRGGKKPGQDGTVRNSVDCSRQGKWGLGELPSGQVWTVDEVDEMEPKGKATTNGVEETNYRVVVLREEQEKALSGDFLRGLFCWLGTLTFPLFLSNFAGKNRRSRTSRDNVD